MAARWGQGNEHTKSPVVNLQMLRMVRRRSRSSHRAHASNRRIAHARRLALHDDAEHAGRKASAGATNAPTNEEKR